MGSYLTIRVQRFEPGRRQSWTDKFHIPEASAEGMTIISALKYIQENLDPSLAFYFSCELGRCRGCLMDVDGEATFTCTAPVKDGIVIAPLADLPVIRDLVVKFLPSEIHLDEAACTGCEACVEACPMDIYTMSSDGATALVGDGRHGGFRGIGDAVDCIGCRRCETACPVSAIRVTHLKELAPLPG